MKKGPLDKLYEAATKEINEIVDSNLEEYSTNKLSAALGKAYKLTVCGEFLSMFESDVFPETVAKTILKYGKDKPLEFLYGAWLDNSEVSSLRTDLKEMILNL